MHEIGKQHSGPGAPAPLAGDGEMGRLTRAYDWSATSLGPQTVWPQSLKIAVNIMLGSRYAMWLGWGPELTFFYNDAYARMTLGPKHPWALGRPAREVWSEIWHDIGPRAESVVRTGQATWDEGLLLFLERNGFPEETYHTFSYSPIPDEHGSIGGMLCVVTEDTERTIAERRLRMLRELAARTGEPAQSVEDACDSATATLAENPSDLPFVLIYLLDDKLLDDRAQEAKLIATTGLAAGSSAAPLKVDLVAEDAITAQWPLANAAYTRQPQLVENLVERFGPLCCGKWPEPLQSAAVLPMLKPGQNQAAGFIVAGISPRLFFDDRYKGFLELLAGHVASAVGNASAYEQERQRAEALAELDRAKTAFFSNVSHEFRTPLSLMLGPVEDMLARSHTELSPANKEHLEVVNRNGLRLLRLVNTLLDFSRIEAGRVRAHFQPTDLAAFTSELASVFRSTCERAGLRLDVDCAPLADPVFVDREMWEKIVLNLLSNAFKFTFQGEIAVTLRQTESAAELRVRDTGTGIPAAEMPRLFERFHRVENSQGRTHEGSGIGLALVQELVKLHGGSITAESVVGQGTTFILSVPLGCAHLPPDQIDEGRSVAWAGERASPYVEEALRWLPGLAHSSDSAEELPAFHEPLATPYQPADQQEGDNRPRVLVADDNADMRHYVARLLAEHYQIEAVPDGEAALAAARIRMPDLVLTDVMMPRLDGFGLLRALRADPRTSGLPVILLSARAGEESRVEGMQAGADDYLVKPFSARELLARVTAHLQMAHMRREASESLRQGEERLRMALSAARMVAWQLDPATGYVTLSDNAADVFGLLPDLPLDSSDQAFGLVHPEDVERHRAQVAKAIDECGSYVSRFRLVRPVDGSVIWVEARGHSVAEGPDKAARLVGVTIDITERKQAEDRERLLLTEAAEANAKFHAFFEQGELFAGIMDVDGTIIEPNRLCLEACGYTRADVVGKPFWECPWWNRSVELMEQIRAASAYAASGESFRAETPYFLADGTQRMVDLSVVPIKDESGRVVFLAPTGADITDRKVAEGKLRSSEERMRLLWEAAAVLLTTDEPDTMLRNLFDKIGPHLKLDTYFNFMVNEAGSGLRLASCIGISEESAHSIANLSFGQAICGTVALQRKPIVATFIQQSDDPKAQLVKSFGIRAYACNPLMAGDQLLGTLSFASRSRDQFAAEELDFLQTICQYVTAAYERLRLITQLKDADRRKDEFLATLAHELRNPLAPLQSGLEVMKLTGGNGEAVGETRSIMERQVGQMVRLIDDLLDLSRISRGKVELRKERVDLAKAVQQAVETSRPAIDRAGHTLTITLPPSPIFVDADLTRLAQVFANLLNNAAKYTEQGGHVWLSVERRESDAVVAVKDNGVGIPANMLPRIFDMFTQVDRSLEKSQGGLGIGLSLVKWLVEMHGGRVEARSEGDGQGSEFIVSLPVALAVVRPQPPMSGERKSAAPKRRILVVDDNRDAARSLAMMLKIMGNETQTAFDGLEAIDVAATFKPEVIMLDIGMPKLNGYEAARRIREMPWGKNIRLVALTGWGQDEDKRKSQEAGFDYHMVKPIEAAALAKILAESQAATG